MAIVSILQVGKSFGAERIFSGVSFQIDVHDSVNGARTRLRTVMVQDVP
jgi:hypothetical protein